MCEAGRPGWGSRNKVPQAPGPRHQRALGCRAVQRTEVGQGERTDQEPNLGSEILATEETPVFLSPVIFKLHLVISRSTLGCLSLLRPSPPLSTGFHLDSSSHD